jgi:hypothetical protein
MDRFEEKFEPVTESGCWLWTARTDKQGYGHFTVSGAKKLAHRFSYELYVEHIPDGLCVCHKCDTPGCVNPKHLFLGTRADNNLDKKQKGRSVNLRGSMHGKAKLTESDVLYIRDEYKKGNIKQKELAEKFNVTQVTISKIVCGLIWCWL